MEIHIGPSRLDIKYLPRTATHFDRVGWRWTETGINHQGPVFHWSMSPFEIPRLRRTLEALEIDAQTDYGMQLFAIKTAHAAGRDIAPLGEQAEAELWSLQQRGLVPVYDKNFKVPLWLKALYDPE